MMSLPPSWATHTSDALMRPTSKLIQRPCPHWHCSRWPVPRWHRSVLELRAERAADGVQVPKDLDVGIHRAGLVVGDAVLLAERAHRRLGAPQGRPRHGGEQVVLDLVVQAAEGEVGEPATADVPGGDHLAAEEIDLLVLAEHRHALVVGGERAAQVEPEHALLD